MTTSTLTIERAGHAVVQDLGRPGYAGLGIPVNGALDQNAARTANILVGNADGAPLIEVTGSELVLVAGTDVLVAVTGAAEEVLVDGHRLPAWEPMAVSRGARILLPVPATGYRSYVAFNGALLAEKALGSTSPDQLLGVGRRLTAGDRLVLRSCYRHAAEPFGRLFRLGARRPAWSPAAGVRATAGPDLGRMARGWAALDGAFRLLPQSDHVGLRLEGAPVEQTSTDEILSRGVPVGAVEVPPTGGIIILLRGRLVTAGYPVVAVVTTESQDLLAQVRPGDALRILRCDVATAQSMVRARAAERSALARRVQNALTGRGLGTVLDPGHGGTTVTAA